MASLQRFIGYLILSLCLVYATFFGLYSFLHPTYNRSSEDRENDRWIATSHSWIDRIACKGIGVCGGTHWTSQTRWWHKGAFGAQTPSHKSDGHNLDWHDSASKPSKWTSEERLLREIPDFVFDYAPLVHLHSEEQFWPTDIADHLRHVVPKINHTIVATKSPGLGKMNELNRWVGEQSVFLSSVDDPEKFPVWLSGNENIPVHSGTKAGLRVDDGEDAKWNDGKAGDILDETARKEGWYEAGLGSSHGAQKRAAVPLADAESLFMTELESGAPKERVHSRDLHTAKNVFTPKNRGKGERSKAPAVLIVVDKGNGIIDAFWFYFYSFNLGQKVLDIRFGNHVGDWEHSMVRFQHGKPKALFLSEHNFGSAYGYDAIEKIGKRPVIYSAIGSHAMYATPGTHPYILPFGLLNDRTNRGPLWDPAQHAHSYTYNPQTDVFLSSTADPHAPTGWFFFKGHWGDEMYPLGDERQYRFAGEYHYVGGPFGPRWKNMGRKKMCQGTNEDPCVIKN